MQTVKNIIKSPRNIKRDLTEKEKILTLSLVILALNFANIIPTSALTYQDNVNVQFTFDPTLSISLSSNNLTIDNLTPGNYGNSNTISVNVSTNNVMGYTLNAKVGGEGQTAASSNLVNTTANTSFTSLGSSDSLTLVNFADNKWGYTTATAPNGSSTTYSGLLYNVDTTINATVNSNGSAKSGYPGTNSTSFTIGAKAASGQLAGNYTNVITFTAVSNAIPSKTIYDLTYMQDFATLTTNEKNSVLEYMPEDTQYRLKDIRDNKLYYIAKLKDGHVWMTQNLDLCIGCTGTRALTSENTDISTTASVYGSSGIYSDYTVEDGVYTWEPASTAVTSEHIITGSGSNAVNQAFATGTTGQTTPYSAEGGTIHIYTSGSTSGDTVYATLAKCVEASHTEAECKHYHVGNYYNWTSAIASNDSTNIGSSNGANATNSICPKGWRLPKATSPREFGNLLLAYNVTTTNSATSYAAGGFNIMRSDPLFFVRGGYVNGSSLSNRASVGYYWSSTVNSSTYAYNLYFSSSNLYSADNSYRYFGFSVRCVARQ